MYTLQREVPTLVMGVLLIPLHRVWDSPRNSIQNPLKLFWNVVGQKVILWDSPSLLVITVRILVLARMLSLVVKEVGVTLVSVFVVIVAVVEVPTNLSSPTSPLPPTVTLLLW